MSLSEKSFNDYYDNYNNESHKAEYFGYFSNAISGYPSTLSIHANVYTQAGNQRPSIKPHKHFDHPFVKDHFAGIDKAEAERRIYEMMNS